MTDSPEPWRLLALPPLSADALGALLGPLPVELSVPTRRDAASVRAALADADLVLADPSGQLRLAAAEIAAAKRLAFIQQPSVGVDGIDLAACAERAIPVANTAGANTDSVAEWCLATSLWLLRSLGWADAEVRRGRWPQLEVAARGSVELSSVRVGIVGFGAIGAGCAARFSVLGSTVSYWSRRRRAPAEEHGASYRDLNDLLATTDLLLVVVPLTEDTRGLLGRERLGLLPRGGYLVNASRGGIVDESALAEALERGDVAGAALDVFDTEPLPIDSPLRHSDRVLLSPHVAGASREAQQRILSAAAENLRRAVEGQPLLDVVNGVDPVVRRR